MSHENLQKFSGGTIRIVVSNHADLGWNQTPEVCATWRRNYDLYRALMIFKLNANGGAITDSTYRYTCESSFPLQEFLDSNADADKMELHPSSLLADYPPWEDYDYDTARKDLYDLTQNGKMQWGAWYTQPYPAILSGEQLIRQGYTARYWIKDPNTGPEDWNYQPKVAANVDAPTTCLQQPQIMRKSGMLGLWVSRFKRGIWNYESPDGSKILGYSPGNYGGACQEYYYTEETGGHWQKITDNSLLVKSGKCWNQPNKYAPYAYYEDQSIHLTDETGDFDTLADNMEDVARFWVDYWADANMPGTGMPNTFPLYYSIDCVGAMSFNDTIEAWNEKVEDSNLPYPKMAYATSEDYLTAVADFLSTNAHVNVPSLAGTRPNIWLYIHGPGHPLALSYKRIAANNLPAVELFNAGLAAWTNTISIRDQALLDTLATAWQQSMWPDVGWGGFQGYTTDQNFSDSYKAALQTSSKALTGNEGVLAKIEAQIDYPVGAGEIRITVFNPLSWKRENSPVRIDIQNSDLSTYSLYDPKTGSYLPWQVVPNATTRSGYSVVEFLANVGSVGYATYLLKPNTTKVASNPASGNQAGSRNCPANTYYQVTVGDHGITGIEDVETSQQIYNTSFTATGILAGDVVIMPGPDGDNSGAGEFTELPQPVPYSEGSGVQWQSLSAASPDRTYWEGEVFSLYKFEGTVQAFGVSGECTVTIQLWVKVYAGSDRITYEVNLPDWVDPNPEVSYDRYSKAGIELRLAFPVAGSNTSVAYEEPMGIVNVGTSELNIPGEQSPNSPGIMPGGWTGSGVYDTPAGEVHPREVQNFMTATTEPFDLTMSTNTAVMDWVDVYQSAKSNWTPAYQKQTVLLQPTLVATRESCYGGVAYGTGAGGMTYRFSISTHQDGQTNYQFGHDCNNPLQAMSTSQAGTGNFLKSGSFLTVDQPNVTVSSLKQNESDENEFPYVLRCYEIAGAESTKVKIELPFRVAQASSLSMLEDTLPTGVTPLDITVSGGAISFTITQNSIETIGLLPES